MVQWYVFAFGAAIAYTIMTIIRKKALSKAHAMNYESVRTIFVVLLAIFLIPFIDFSFDKTYLLWVYAVSVLATAAILLASKALRHNEISLVAPLSNLRPAFVAIIAFIFLSETLGVKQIIGIIILFISAYILEADHHFSNVLEPIKHLAKSKYSLYYTFAVFLFAVTTIFHKYIFSTKLNNVFTYFFFIWIFIAVNFNIVHAVKYGLKDSISCLKEVRFLPLAHASFSTIGNLMEFTAISMAYVSLVQPIIIISVLFVVLFGGKFFHEKNLLFRLAISVL
ncbi:EamA family transporter, partial [Candidatus Woesearchaeota archaeon]|nr:EamA family transporter [Candidatus Woesearchaeota archaeon]